ncbi:PREDICTED: uncharacterized protein LOC109189099 [Ipomoea nil]|uniref:uncharacterized protein LOC109189099 n=1 Tax=Ipomoea nil TaxID=35883 RepID=UPI000901F394|nr:PREDICTED: uncharacterized protein LOC109189099 [Ipomoea nil]XP_019195384.1 PREDICTED: uncharacterized protein LOC109189099 [Ipomoea nil]
MEKILNQYEKEYMKMAMLKHEETFREQVYELHRLYQIQKILMKNIAVQKRQETQERELKNAHNLTQDSDHKRTRQILDLERPVADEGGIEDESELELTLGPSCYNRRRRKAALEPSDSAPSFSSSTDSHGKESSREDLKWGIELPAALNQSFLQGQKSSNVEELQFRQDRLNNPPWLFQALSLNMT